MLTMHSEGLPVKEESFSKMSVFRTSNFDMYKKDLHDPDNHDGMITHLEPDILSWRVKSSAVFGIF